jgi:hypothetical protein
MPHQPNHRQRSPPTIRHKHTVLNQRTPTRQPHQPLNITPKLRTRLHTFKIIQHQPSPIPLLLPYETLIEPRSKALAPRAQNLIGMSAQATQGARSPGWLDCRPWCFVQWNIDSGGPCGGIGALPLTRCSGNVPVLWPLPVLWLLSNLEECPISGI